MIHAILVRCDRDDYSLCHTLEEKLIEFFVGDQLTFVQVRNNERYSFRSAVGAQILVLGESVKDTLLDLVDIIFEGFISKQFVACGHLGAPVKMREQGDFIKTGKLGCILV
jgi:hypothetical protein